MTTDKTPETAGRMDWLLEWDHRHFNKMSVDAWNELRRFIATLTERAEKAEAALAIIHEEALPETAVGRLELDAITVLQARVQELEAALREIKDLDTPYAPACIGCRDRVTIAAAALTGQSEEGR